MWRIFLYVMEVRTEYLNWLSYVLKGEIDKHAWYDATQAYFRT
jgi:hypothetical protein